MFCSEQRSVETESNLLEVEARRLGQHRAVPVDLLHRPLEQAARIFWALREAVQEQPINRKRRHVAVLPNNLNDRLLRVPGIHHLNDESFAECFCVVCIRITIARTVTLMWKRKHASTDWGLQFGSKCNNGMRRECVVGWWHSGH